MINQDELLQVRGEDSKVEPGARRKAGWAGACLVSYTCLPSPVFSLIAQGGWGKKDTSEDGATIYSCEQFHPSPPPMPRLSKSLEINNA
ncbi:hypothetical protein TSMEX_002678 [Taenia solium]|eukprot:TsM_000131100 transcript=TsM_000131100 gene=TsM_000131100